MNRGDRFATKIETMDGVPEPFRHLILERLSPGEPARSLIYGPPLGGPSTGASATLLAVTDRRWLVVSEDPNGCTSVAESEFAETLFVEQTHILLYGQLRLAYAAGGTAASRAVEFNTVMAAYYEAAAQQVQDGIDGASGFRAQSRAEAASLLQGWPLKFLNAALWALPRGHRLLDAIQWPAVRGRFRRELAPAAALLLTDRALLPVSEEKAPWWALFTSLAKYGQIAAYLPLRRIARFSLSQQERFHVLSVELNSGQGRSQFEILFPPEHRPAVSQLMDRVRP